MSDQTGFDYDAIISHLHGGLCAFQSLRAHRRERAQAAAAAAAPPPTVAPSPAPANPAPRVAPADDRAELRANASLEPQAFVAMGDRVVPLFGSLNAGLFSVSPAGPMTTPIDPVATPPVAPPPSAAPASPPSTPPPAVTSVPPAEARPPTSAATLRLPPPTPPPQLGLILGGRPTPEPGAEPPADRPQASEPAVPASIASIVALLDTRAHDDAQRLERAQAEHHAAMATLQRAHREEMRAQSEADAARTTALLREVLAEHRAELRAQSEADVARTTALLLAVFNEHRAELARTQQAHADHLAQVLAQRSQGADPPAAAGDMTELRTALAEQASMQRDANEAVAEHFDALSSIIADLGHTVGTLAVAAAQKAQHADRSVQFRFSAPPRALPATVHAAPSEVEPAGPAPRDPSATTDAAESPPLEPACCSPPALAPAPPHAVPAAADPPCAASLTRAITRESPRSQAIPLKLQDADRAHIHDELENDDDGDLETAREDDDEPERHPRLRPLTDIDLVTEGAAR